LMRLSSKKGAHAGPVQSWVQEIRGPAQMTPAIYHKRVAIGASATGWRKIERPTGTLFGRNTQS
jgi:hypothetical protein